MIPDCEYHPISNFDDFDAFIFSENMQKEHGAIRNEKDPNR